MATTREDLLAALSHALQPAYEGEAIAACEAVAAIVDRERACAVCGYVPRAGRAVVEHIDDARHGVVSANVFDH